MRSSSELGTCDVDAVWIRRGLWTGALERWTAAGCVIHELASWWRSGGVNGTRGIPMGASEDGLLDGGGPPGFGAPAVVLIEFWLRGGGAASGGICIRGLDREHTETPSWWTCTQVHTRSTANCTGASHVPPRDLCWSCVCLSRWSAPFVSGTGVRGWYCPWDIRQGKEKRRSSRVVPCPSTHHASSEGREGSDYLCSRLGVWERWSRSSEFGRWTIVWWTNGAYRRNGFCWHPHTWRWDLAFPDRDVLAAGSRRRGEWHPLPYCAWFGGSCARLRLLPYYTESGVWLTEV